MTHAAGIIGLLAVLAWLLPALGREARAAHVRGLDRAHGGRSWTAREACRCVPCTTPAYGAPWLPHCAACCGGSLIAEYEHDCPDGDHVAMAVLQWGPA